MAGPQHQALEQRRVRQAVQRAQAELDPVKRAALFIKMNDLVCKRQRDHPGGVPAARRGRVHKLQAPLSGWDNDLWA